MKKYYVLAAFITALLIFSNCSSSKKIAAIPKSTYAADLSMVIMNNCSPCHIPSKGGFKKAYDNYDNVKTDIDEIMRRIKLLPAERGFMPFKKTAPLPDSTIAKFTKWRDDGLLEK